MAGYEFERGALIATSDIGALGVRTACAALAQVCEHVAIVLPESDTAVANLSHSTLSVIQVPPIPELDASEPAAAAGARQVLVSEATAESVAGVAAIDAEVARLRAGRPSSGPGWPRGKAPRGTERFRLMTADLPAIAREGEIAATLASLRAPADPASAAPAARRSSGHRRRARPWLRSPRVPLELSALVVNFGPALEDVEPEVAIALDLGALGVCRELRGRARDDFRLLYLPAWGVNRDSRVARLYEADADVIEPALPALPLRQRSPRAATLNVRKKAKVPEDAPLVVCHFGLTEPLTHVGELIRLLTDAPETYAVVLAQDHRAELRQLQLAAQAARVDRRLRPVNAPDPDYLTAFLRTATAGWHLAGEGEGPRPATLVALRLAGRPVLAAPGSPLAGLDGVTVTDDPAAALQAGLAEAPAPEELRWEPHVERLAGEISVDGGRATEPSLLIGPRDGNLQAQAWAAALREADPGVRVETLAVAYTGQITTPEQVDHFVPLSSWTALDWQLLWARVAMSRFTHVLLEQALTALGTLGGSKFFQDVPTLAEHGVHAGLVFRGSEIRDPAAHAARERWSPFSDPQDDLTAKLQRNVNAVMPHVRSFTGSKFVTTLDLLDDVPDATWLPQVLDLATWHEGDTPLQARRPVVLHAPSRAQLKGSASVDAVCAKLADAGAIEYRRLRGVPYSEMPSAIRGADIVLDQFALGSYGVLALQAMASGRVVIGHIADHVRARVDGELPVIQATPDELEAVVLSTIAEADAARATAQAGRAYVDRFHSGPYSAALLREFLRARPE